MADEELNEQEETGGEELGTGEVAPKSFFSLRNMIIIAVGIIIAVLGAYIVVTKILFPAEAEKEAVKEKPLEELVNKVVMLDPVVVNISGTEGELRYLKVTVGIELNDPSLQEEIDLRKPQILDVLIRVFSSRNIYDVTETRGRDSIRREIKTRLNDILEKGRLLNVYFTEFVIQ